MKRRSFLLTAGSAILSATGVGNLQKPAFGLEFKLSSVPDRRPSSVQSVLVDFAKFELTPQYVDDSKEATVDINVDVDGHTGEASKTVDVTNGESVTSEAIGSETPIKVDGVSTSENSISGKINIVVRHSSVGRKEYNQSFVISDNPIVNGLVAYYPMEKGGGKILNDATKNNRGVIDGATWSDNSLFGYHALSFDGSDDYVDIGRGIGEGLSELTVSAWINTDDISNAHQVVGADGSNVFQVFTDPDGSYGNKDGMVFGIADSNGTWYRTVSNKDINTNNWYFVTAVYDGEYQRIYINGQESGSSKIGSITTNQPNDKTFIGANNSNNTANGNWWNGLIKNFRIYDRALSSAEIGDLYSSKTFSGDRVTDSDVPNQENGGVSRYEFESDTIDSWGSNNGTDNTGSSEGYVSGVYGSAKDFNGGSGYIDVNYGDGGEIIYTDWTVSGWINVFDWSDSNRKEWLSVSEDRTDSRPLDFVHESGSIKHYRGKADGEVMSHGVSDETGWHQMTVTQNRISSNTVDLIMYFDGERVDSTTADYENMRPSLKFNIGRSVQGNLNWNGGIDDIRLYNETLSQSQVKKLYRLGSYVIG